MPVYRGKRDFPGRMLLLAAGAVARAAAISEAFHCVEEKHVQDVRSFHVVQSFHAEAGTPTRHTGRTGHRRQLPAAVTAVN